MKIAGNEVKGVTRDTAQVGCTKVTRASVGTTRSSYRIS